jgi:hypothetical protein
LNFDQKLYVLIWLIIKELLKPTELPIYPHFIWIHERNCLLATMEINLNWDKF